MRKERTLVSFDWALKPILRDKANFDVLEGFVSTLLRTDVKIHRLLESESNKERDDAKANRVDILAEKAEGEMLHILKVNDFNRWSRVPLEQWIYFLSTSEIPEDADAPGLKEAREKLQLAKMRREEQTAYRCYVDDRVILADQIYTARGEGKLEGHFEGREEGLKEGLAEGRAKGPAEGRAEGRMEANIEHARKMKEKGLDYSIIRDITGLSIVEIENLR